MFPSLRYGLLCVLTALLFSACTDPGPTNDRPNVNPPDNRPVTMRILTTSWLAQDQTLLTEFEARYNTNIEVTVLTPAELRRAIATGQLPTAEVILTPTLEDAVALRAGDHLQPFFVNAFMDGNVADRYQDREGYYSGLTRYTMTAVYNPNALAEGEVTSYRGLLDAGQRGVRIGIPAEEHLGLTGTVAGLHAVLGEPAARLWNQGIRQYATGGMRGTPTATMDAMLRGELDAAFMNSGDIIRWFLDGNQDHYKAGELWRVRVPKTTASDDNIPNFRCITLRKDAGNRNLAMAYIDYLYEIPVQQRLSDAYFEWPCRTFAETNDYLHAFKGAPGRIPMNTLEDHVAAARVLMEE